MAELNSSIPQLNYRKAEPPSEVAVLAEAKELLRYDENLGFIWVKIRGKVPHKLIGSVAGGESGRGYLTISLLYHRFAVHRLVWLWHHGEWPSGMIDHVNGDKKDNRIENLRIASSVQNAWNSARSESGGVKGVSKTPSGKFNARIQPLEGEKIYLGTYDTEKEASAAYIGAATILQGDFAFYKRQVAAINRIGRKAA